MKVSSSPVDFDFKVYNPDDLNDISYSGQGRRYIRDHYPNVKYMDYDRVLVKGFRTEEEALEYEQFIVKEYGLFES